MTIREMLRNSGIAVAVSVTLPCTGDAQTSRQDPTDTQAWYGAQVSANLPNGWESSLQYRARYIGDASQFRGSYFTAGLEKKLSKHLALSGSYRLASVEAATFHRIAAGSAVSGNVRELNWSLRALVQHQRKTFEDNDETSGESTTFLRTRLQLKRDITTRVSVYASTEPYFTFGADYPVDNWRNTIGTKFTLASGQKLDLFYIYRPDYAKAYNRAFHVIGTELDLSFKIRGQKKAKVK